MEINVEKPKAVRMSRQPCLRVLRAFSSVVRQMSGENPQRRHGPHSSKRFVLFYVFSVFVVLCIVCVCVCVCV